MNLGQMRAVVRRRIGNPTTTDVANSVIDGHVNDALEEIRDKYKFLRARGRARFVTVAGVDKYSVAEVTDVILKVWDRTNKLELGKVGPSFVASSEFDGLRQSKPRFYARFEDYIQLIGDRGGAPDGAYTVEILYKSKFAALVADADEPDLPRTWHKGVTILAAYNYYDTDGKDAAKAQVQFVAWRNWIADKPVEAHEETEAIDSGVQLPTFRTRSSVGRKPDGTWWDSEP